MPFIVLTIIIVVVLLVAKAIRDAQQGPSAQPASPREPRPTRMQSRSQPRPRRSPKPEPVDEEALAQHVTKLREAIGAGLITTDEAVASVCRFTDGVLSEEAARELLRHRGAA